MPKTKTPDPSDWEVTFADPAAAGRAGIIIRATLVDTSDRGWFYLRDTAGGLLFGCPAQHVAHFRRISDEERATQASARAESAAAEKVAGEPPPARRSSGGGRRAKP